MMPAGDASSVSLSNEIDRCSTAVKDEDSEKEEKMFPKHNENNSYAPQQFHDGQVLGSPMSE